MPTRKQRKGATPIIINQTCLFQIVAEDYPLSVPWEPAARKAKYVHLAHTKDGPVWRASNISDLEYLRQMYCYVLKGTENRYRHEIKVLMPLAERGRRQLSHLQSLGKDRRKRDDRIILEVWSEICNEEYWCGTYKYVREKETAKRCRQKGVDIDARTVRRVVPKERKTHR